MDNISSVMTTTNDCLQICGGKQIVSKGGYSFEIIEIDEKNESHNDLQFVEDEGNSLGNEDNGNPVRKTVDGAWSTLPWNCDICSQVFYSPMELIQHSDDLHQTKIADIQWICPDCLLKFRYYYTLVNHIRILHREYLDLTCDICDKKCVSIEELDDHRREGHKDCSLPAVVHCMICRSGYRDKWYLQRHIKLSHENKVRHECSICKKVLRSKSSLANHILVHGTAKHVCQLCGNMFFRRRNLTDHLATHTAGSFQCRLCNKYFRHSSTLSFHMTTTHTNSKKTVSSDVLSA